MRVVTPGRRQPRRGGCPARGPGPRPTGCSSARKARSASSPRPGCGSSSGRGGGVGVACASPSFERRSTPPGRSRSPACTRATAGCSTRRGLAQRGPSTGGGRARARLRVGRPPGRPRCSSEPSRSDRGARRRGDRRRAAATPPARPTSWRSSFLRCPTSATRWPGARWSSRRSRRRAPGTASPRCTRGHRGRPGGGRAGLRRSGGHLPVHPRLPRRPGALLTVSTPPALGLAGRAVGRGEGGGRREAIVATAAPSPTTTRWAATTAPGTTSSGPTRSPPPCAAAKAVLDPAGVLNPGVLLDADRRGTLEP